MQELDLTSLNAEYKSMKKVMDTIRKPPSAGAARRFAAFQEMGKTVASENFFDSWLQVPVLNKAT